MTFIAVAFFAHWTWHFSEHAVVYLSANARNAVPEIISVRKRVPFLKPRNRKYDFTKSNSTTLTLARIIGERCLLPFPTEVTITAGLRAHHHNIFPYLVLQSHSLWSSATAPLPTLHQFFGTDSQKTSVSLLILLTHLLISPILRSNSPLLHPTHDWKPNYLSYPNPV